MNERHVVRMREPTNDPYPDLDTQPEPIGIPIARLFAVLRRHYLLILAVIILGVGGTTAMVIRLPDQYTASATLLMEPQRTQVSDLQAISPEFNDTASLVRTQMDILRSPSLARKVVTTLNLQNDPSFMGGGGPIAQVKGWVHAQLNRFVASGAAQDDGSAQIARAAAVLESRMGFVNAPHSQVLEVTVTTARPELSAAIANALADQYLNFRRHEKFAAMQRASAWFESQLDGLAKRVRTEEMAAEAYRAKHGLVDLPRNASANGPAATSVTRQQLSDVAKQLGDASRTLAQKEAELVQARRALRERRTSALPEVLVSPVIVQLLTRKAEVESKEASLATSRGHNNPDLIAARAESRNVQAAIVREMSNIVRSLDTEVSATHAQVKSLKARMSQLTSEVGTNNLSEIGLRGLEDKARATRAIYENFLGRATELANVAGIQQPDATLVSGAQPPLRPSGPLRLRLIAVAGILSSVLGIGFAAMIERGRRGFSSANQIEATLGLPVIALAPRLPRSQRTTPLAKRLPKEYSAALANLRGRLRLAGLKRPKVVMLSSAMPDEGKTLLATTFAADAAAVGWKVLLIECDFHRPSMARKLGIPSRYGLSEMLDDRLASDDHPVIGAVRPSLDVILAGEGGGDAHELLSSERMDDLLAVARDHYDLIVLDTPPLLPTADAISLARHADATLLVVRWETTPRAAVQDAVRLLREGDARLLGAVLTGVDLRTSARLAGRPAAVYDYGSTRA